MSKCIKCIQLEEKRIQERLKHEQAEKAIFEKLLAVEAENERKTKALEEIIKNNMPKCACLDIFCKDYAKVIDLAEYALKGGE